MSEQIELIINIKENCKSYFDKSFTLIEPKPSQELITRLYEVPQEDISLKIILETHQGMLNEITLVDLMLKILEGYKANKEILDLIILKQEATSLFLLSSMVIEKKYISTEGLTKILQEVSQSNCKSYKQVTQKIIKKLKERGVVPTLEKVYDGN